MATSRSLYVTLGLTAAATQAEIRKAYLRLAVQLHPDKNPGDESANERFQTLNKVYSVLGDEKRRKVYDDTGIASDFEGPSSNSFDDLYDYYRSMYQKASRPSGKDGVTEEDIDAFEQKYRGSEEERDDVVKYYRRFHGDMHKVFEWVMCSDPALDSHRFADMIRTQLSQQGEQPSKRFVAWEAKIRKRKTPANPLAPRKSGGGKKKGKENDGSSLVTLIRGRRAADGGFLDALAAKYGVDPGAGRAEPPEEAFRAAGARQAQRKPPKDRK